MTPDPIVEEIHQVRAKLSQEYNSDLHAFCEAVRQSQGKNGHIAVSRAPRLAQQGSAPEKPAPASENQFSNELRRPS